MNSLPPLSLLITEGSELSFRHWHYQPESQQYVLHNTTVVADSPAYGGYFVATVRLRDALVLGYRSRQQSNHSESREDWVILRLDSLPQPGQEVITSTHIRTFQSLGAIATDSRFLWVGAEGALLLLDQNLETLDQVSLEGSWSFIPGKNAHDILVHQGTAYVLDNIVSPILLFQAKVNRAQKLELTRTLELQGISIHLEQQWLNPQLNHWVVLESGSGGLAGLSWQYANIFPMSLTETSDTENIPTLDGVQVLARTANAPFWTILQDPLMGCCLTCFQAWERDAEIGERIPLALQTDFRGQYRLEIEQFENILRITQLQGPELLYYKQFLVFINTSSGTSVVETIDESLENLEQIPTRLAHQRLFTKFFGRRDLEESEEGFRIIATTHLPSIWAVIYVPELKDCCLALLDTVNNQLTAVSKLPLEWGVQDQACSVILKEQDNLLIILNSDREQLLIVDVEQVPQIVHRQNLGKVVGNGLVSQPSHQLEAASRKPHKKQRKQWKIQSLM